MQSDSFTLAFFSPITPIKSKLSVKNQHLLGYNTANIFIKRHQSELRRCSQFYSLASLFNERVTKDKHRKAAKNIRTYLLRLFRCLSPA